MSRFSHTAKLHLRGSSKKCFPFRSIQTREDPAPKKHTDKVASLRRHKSSERIPRTSLLLQNPSCIPIHIGYERMIKPARVRTASCQKSPCSSSAVFLLAGTFGVVTDNRTFSLIVLTLSSLVCSALDIHRLCVAIVAYTAGPLVAFKTQIPAGKQKETSPCSAHFCCASRKENLMADAKSGDSGRSAKGKSRTMQRVDKHDTSTEGLDLFFRVCAAKRWACPMCNTDNLHRIQKCMCKRPRGNVASSRRQTRACG